MNEREKLWTILETDCSGNCEQCDYVNYHYPNSFDDPYIGCIIHERILEIDEMEERDE